MADLAVEVRIDPSNIQRLIDRQVELITQRQDRRREDHLLRYFGLDPEQLVRDRCTFRSWRDDQRRATVVEIRDTDDNIVQSLPVPDEALYEVERSFGRIGRAFAQMGAAVSVLSPTLAQFGQAAIEAEREAARQAAERLLRRGIEPEPDVQFSSEYHPSCDCTDCRTERNNPAAKQNARALLLSCLTPAQQEQYQETGSFTVTVPSGNRYRIESHRYYNVVRLNKEGRPQTELCAGPVEDVPVEDQMLAQKLLLETDEAGFLAVANGREVGADIRLEERMEWRQPMRRYGGGRWDLYND